MGTQQDWWSMLTSEEERRLHQAARKFDKAREDRDRLIREAVAKGGSLREVAEAVGLSHPGVKKIVERGFTVPASDEKPDPRLIAFVESGLTADDLEG